jgi:recombinational DNA repair ATPase RecF
MQASARGGKYNEWLRLTNFTVFRDTEFRFVPGINAFIGENGTGKTHVMKALYAMLSAGARRRRKLFDTLWKSRRMCESPGLRSRSASS